MMDVGDVFMVSEGIVVTSMLFHWSEMMECIEIVWTMEQPTRWILVCKSVLLNKCVLVLWNFHGCLNEVFHSGNKGFFTGAREYSGFHNL